MAIKVYVNDNGTPTLVEMAATSTEALAKLVSAAQAQDFTDEEKAQARSNIGAFATTGGSITGQIINAIGDLIRQSKTDGYTSIKGGTSNDTGGYVTAYGKDHENAGNVILGAYNGTSRSELVLRADSTLTWGGKSVERVDSSGTGWIRYVNGLQIVFGYVKASNNTATITYPVPFSGGETNGGFNPVFWINTAGSTSASIGATSMDHTGATIKVVSTSTDTGWGVRYHVIGKWK